MPAGVMTAPRLAPPSALPRSMKNANSTTGLSLGLGADGSQREASQTADSQLPKIKNKDEDYESRSGSDNLEGGSCEEQDTEPPKKKRYHRHTPRQIQEMEMLFKGCPHPDDKQRQELSRELGLSPRQVKFWFQNRRTQLKAQQGRSDNSVLRMENDNFRAENVLMQEALKNISCPNCEGPATVRETMTCDEQQLRVQNARLKDEIDRVSAIAAKYLGRTIPSYSAYQPQIPSLLLDLPTNPIGTLVPHTLVQGRSWTDLASRPGSFSDAEKPLVVELAVAAMDELLHMCQPEETSWMPSIDGAKEILIYEEYIRKYFGALGERPFGLKTDATRETGLLLMNGLNLVEVLMDSARWMEMFPCIISRACTLDVLSTGVTGNRNGALQLMYSELQILSPLVPTREFYFLRYCKQHVEGVWAVVDVSIDMLRDNPPESLMQCRRRPSGYLIQDMPNGYAKVTVLDHIEYDDRAVNHMYSALVNSGRAFGAQRWLATLQCQCERLASFLATNISSRELGVIPSANGRRSMLKLAQRMTSNFCAGVSASTIHTWTALSGTGENDVRVMTRKSENNPGEPYGIVLSAATSLWLPVTPQRVFEFLRDEHVRNEWDILSNGGIVQEMANIAKGQDPGNSVSLLKVNALNSSICNMLILQESSIDVSGCLVVYAPVDIPAMNIVMQGGDPGCVSLLPSGFAILPDGPERESESKDVDIAMSTGGSLLTVAFQILVSNTPSAKLSLESVATVNKLISCTVQKIKAALNCEHIRSCTLMERSSDVQQS